MRATVLGSAMILGLALVAGSALHAFSHRYAVVGTSSGAFEIDAWSGKVWLLFNGKVLQPEVAAEASLSNSGTPLPPAELAKIVAGKVHGAGSSLEGDFYNGSAWELNRIVFSVTAQDREGAPLWTRDYAVWRNTQAWTSGVAQIDSTWLPEGASATWAVKEASGTPPPRE